LAQALRPTIRTLHVELGILERMMGIARTLISFSVVFSACTTGARAIHVAGPPKLDRLDALNGILDGRNEHPFDCAYMKDDVAHNLNDYARFFAMKTQSRTKIKFIGDSLLEQYFETFKCAAKILGMHTEDTAFCKPGDGDGWGEFCNMRGAVIKHSANATGGVEITLRKFWKFTKIPDEQNCHYKWKCDMSYADFCSATEGYDYVFANLGHHELRNHETGRFEQMLNTVFKETQQCGLRNHVRWIGHPPSHFNSADGSYFDQGNDNDNAFFTTHCTCDLPREKLEQQPIIRNSQLAEQLAHQYGFSYISIWQDYIMKCDAHPRDCTHYPISPAHWMPLTRQLLKHMLLA